MMLLDLFTFLGRLHPMVVHLPIGFLLLASAFDLMSRLQKFDKLRSAIPVILLAGFISAIVAAFFGYLLSLTGDYHRATLYNHKVSGIMLAFISGILWFTSTPYFQKVIVFPAKATTALSLVVVLLVMYVGHQGGTLTHGSDYLTIKTLTESQRALPASMKDAMIFEDVIQPIFEKRCTGCHRDGKSKGGLKLTSWDAIVKGGKDGPVLVAGNLQKSDLYRRITLEPDHEDFMPTDGKTPLTKPETKIIAWWIANGIEKDKKLMAIKGHEAILPSVAFTLGFSSEVDEEDKVNASGREVNHEIPAQVSPALIENLRKAGFVVRVMSHKPVMLDVTLPPQSNVSMDLVEKQLLAAAKNVIWLNVSDNNVKDDQIVFLHDLVNVEKIRLERNPLTDKVADVLIGMKHLEAVNLNETLITTKGYLKIRESKSVKRIYTWKTTVSQTEK